MIELLAFWYMFPIALTIATVALMFGIGGAVFFSPFFFIVLSLEPKLAISLGLLIEVFGFSSGLIGYANRKMINYHLGSRILPFTLTAAIVGSIVGKSIPTIVLEVLLATVILALGLLSLRYKKNAKYIHYPFHHSLENLYQKENKKTSEKVSWFDFWKDFRKKPSVFELSFLGGLVLGLTSSGLGEVNEYNFVKRLKIEIGTAAGSSVFIVAISAIVASLFNISYFSFTDQQDIIILSKIAVFAIPGVIIGGQLGALLSKKTNREKTLKVLPFLFIFIASITFLKVILTI